MMRSAARLVIRSRSSRSRPLSRDKRWVVETVVKREIRTADQGVGE